MFGDQGHHGFASLCSESTLRTHQVTGRKDGQQEGVKLWLTLHNETLHLCVQYVPPKALDVTLHNET